MARIPPVDPSDFDGDPELLKTRMSADDLDEEYAELFSSRVRNVHRTIANNPEVLEAFREFMGSLKGTTDVSARELELIILAAAAGSGSRYEWHQHARFGLSSGISEDEIRAISAGEFETFDGGEAALLSYIDAYVRGEVTDECHEAFAEQFDTDDQVGISMIASGYLGLARALEAFGVELEEPFVGWDLEGI